MVCSRAAAFIASKMAYEGCLQMLCGCSFCCLWIAWWVCGGLALSYTYEDAEGCGWWMWVTFLVELIYAPFGILFGLAYMGMAGAALCCATDEETSMGNGCADGCVRGCLFLVLNVLNGLLLGFVSKGLWDEDCIPAHTQLRAMALTGFWLCAVITGLNILLAVAEFIKKACVPGQPS